MKTLRNRIALSAIAISILASLVAAFVPGLLYDIRDQLFLASLAADQRAALAELIETSGQCSPDVEAFKMCHGFGSWQLNYNWALASLIFITSIFCAAVAFASARWIAAPIADLAAHAKRVAEGERQAPPPLSSAAPREIAELHANFSAMVAALAAADDDVRLRSAAIAHELRTPLSVLRGRLVGLTTGVFQLDDALVSSMLRQVTVIDQLVSDLNLLAAQFRPDMVIERSLCDLAEIATSVVETLRPDAEARGGRLVLDAELTSLAVDPVRLERALSNLVENAIRYAPGSLIKVSVRSTDEEARLVVQDSGPGWPGTDPRVFVDAFKRGDGSRSRASGGSGLGLTIVNAIVRAHGGELRLSSNPAGGAVAEILLPRHRT